MVYQRGQGLSCRVYLVSLCSATTMRFRGRTNKVCRGRASTLLKALLCVVVRCCAWLLCLTPRAIRPNCRQRCSSEDEEQGVQKRAKVPLPSAVVVVRCCALQCVAGRAVRGVVVRCCALLCLVVFNAPCHQSEL